jgi:hypothetical protein
MFHFCGHFFPLSCRSELEPAGLATHQASGNLSQDTLIDAANVVPFKMDLPMVSMVKTGTAV